VDLRKFSFMSVQIQNFDMNFRNMIINTKVNLSDFETICEDNYRLDCFDFITIFTMYNTVDML
jgi:hypothetical protein